MTSYSFPSGHSTQSAAFVTALLLTLLSTRCPRRVKDGVAAAAFLLALGVAASRVYLGVHYPSDVICGLALGTACAMVASHYVTGPPTGSSTPEPNASRSVAP